ncbi:MAG TPA: hypothetical protein VGM88_14310 [Kofleriaceae bacterium]|jgi:hypothetical protein
MLLVVLATLCFDPAAYGGKPDDDKPDNAAIQKAVDAAEAVHDGTVCLGAGVWNVTKLPGKVGSIEVTGSVRIRGVGPKTILRMTGPAGRHDWRALEIWHGAHDIVLSEFRIDGLGAFDTEEQTHLIELGPDTRDVTVARMQLGPMRWSVQEVGAGIGGDCIRLLGEPDHIVQDVTIAQSKFVDCDRSAIGMQREVHDLVVADIDATAVGDQAIDFEPTGNGGIQDCTFVRMTLRQAPDTQSSWSITLNGFGPEVARRLVVANSSIQGGIGMLNVDGVEIVGNEILDDHARFGANTINVMRRGDHVHIANNHVRRGGYPASLVRATWSAGERPHGLVVENNTLEQTTDAPVVEVISSDDVTVRANAITVRADSTQPAVKIDAIHNDIDGITIERNAVTGARVPLVRAGTRKTWRIGKITTHGNTGADESDTTVHAPGR